MNPRYLPTIKEDKLIWLAVDFDGVIAKSIWPEHGIGELISGANEALDEFIGMGYKIVIHISRS